MVWRVVCSDVLDICTVHLHDCSLWTYQISTNLAAIENSLKVVYGNKEVLKLDLGYSAYLSLSSSILLIITVTAFHCLLLQCLQNVFPSSHHIQKFFDQCENGDNCYKNPDEIANYDCRICRFQQCLRAEMIQKLDKLELSDTIENLCRMEMEKWNLFVNFRAPDNITFEDVTDSTETQFTKKSPITKNTYHDWEFINHVVTIDFIKKLDFVKLLTSSDSKVFLKSCYLNVCIVALAVQSYLSKLDNITYPEGCPVFPDEMNITTSKCPKVENRIKCRVIGKLRELNITKEEFLLLNIIFICNPDVPNMSETGRLLLNCYQRMYGSLLLKYCQVTYQKHAPTRYTDLLSICNVISKTRQDINSVAILFQIYQPAMEWKQMIRGAIDYHSK
ncbi:Protein CBG18170 [Caenorhabditis briggsae]|uniref:Protein CBG18170 n=1 Tax=Caenorhabditis briggsae TaxID=6238 RepID=A8XT64_CAEBR|nr:Protein CBG18170 [Caenorhabditis briggsae]CAP35667.1 Protein CBG18170 [Caenorhabditis briggsae]